MSRGYFTDIENAKKLGLTGTTLQVYSTLRFLCQNQPWKRNDPELADKSGCGSRMTATRAVEKLKSSGLIFENDKTITLKLNAQNEQINAQNEQTNAQNEQKNAQNEQKNAQNEQIDAQNEQISKEKEKNQKNKENKKEVVVEEKDVPSQPQQPIFIFNPPTWEELVTFGTQKNIPISLIKKFYAYYTANNWMLRKGCKMENWKGALTYWKETEKKGGQASTQAQASYAGSQYADYLARQQQAKIQDALRQADDQHRYISYDEYKKTKE